MNSWKMHVIFLTTKGGLLSCIAGWVGRVGMPYGMPTLPTHPTIQYNFSRSDLQASSILEPVFTLTLTLSTGLPATYSYM